MMRFIHASTPMMVAGTATSPTAPIACQRRKPDKHFLNMTDAPDATSNEQPNRVVPAFYLRSIERLKHSAVAGFVFTVFLVFLGQRSGADGRKGLELLERFVDHSTPNKTLYIVSLGLLGLSVAFSRALLADLIRKWLARPLIELSSHAFAVAIGMLLALLASAAYVHDIRANIGGLCLATFVAVTVYLLLQLALAAAEGEFDKHIQSNMVYEVVACVLGACVTWAAFQDLSLELEHSAQHKAKSTSEAPPAPGAKPEH